MFSSNRVGSTSSNIASALSLEFAWKAKSTYWAGDIRVMDLYIDNQQRYTIKIPQRDDRATQVVSLPFEKYNALYPGLRTTEVNYLIINNLDTTHKITLKAGIFNQKQGNTLTKNVNGSWSRDIRFTREDVSIDLDPSSLQLGKHYKILLTHLSERVSPGSSFWQGSGLHATFEENGPCRKNAPLPQQTTAASTSFRADTMVSQGATFFASAQSSDLTNPVYFRNAYPSSHWANHLPVIGDKNFIATLEIDDVKIALKLNETDSRGYRSIVGLVSTNEEDMSSTFNRNYTIKEKLALNAALCVLSTAYENYGMIAQIEIAGNNSQSVTKDGLIQFGNEKEPSLLHAHVIGRGNPENKYLSTVSLRGPVAGAMFNMRGDGLDKGNESKTRWEDNEMDTVADVLANEVVNILESTPELRNIVLVSSRVQSSFKLGK